jgi:phosphoenolpyruvate carboxylase
MIPIIDIDYQKALQRERERNLKQNLIHLIYQLNFKNHIKISKNFQNILLLFNISQHLISTTTQSIYFYQSQKQNQSYSKGEK